MGREGPSGCVMGWAGGGLLIGKGVGRVLGPGMGQAGAGQ